MEKPVSSTIKRRIQTRSALPLSKVAVVTGGAGFIGSHLVDVLVDLGYRVSIIDDLSSGRVENIRRSIDSGRAELLHCDIRDLGKLVDAFHASSTVFHLAAIADVVPSINDPLLYYEVNANGTACVMEAARIAGVKNVVYAASSSCYGLPDLFPTPETAPCRPQYPYALTKYLGEQIALHWGMVYGIGVKSLRLFNVFGPRHRTSGAYGAVLGVFLAQKLANEPLTIVGDGKQTRDFTYVTDVALAFVAAAASNRHGEVFNVGSGGTHSVGRLADLIGGTRTYVPKRPGEPDCTFADISKITKLLGWRPKTTFESGVEKVLESIEDWRGAPVWTPESIAVATKSWFEQLGAGKKR